MNSTSSRHTDSARRVDIHTAVKISQFADPDDIDDGPIVVSSQIGIHDVQVKPVGAGGVDGAVEIVRIFPRHVGRFCRIRPIPDHYPVTGIRIVRSTAVEMDGIASGHCLVPVGDIRRL